MNDQISIEILNDLIGINNDRMADYEKAITLLDEDSSSDLKLLFRTMINNSRDYNTELQREISLMGGAPDTGTSGKGNLYRLWLSIKAAFGGDDRKTILSYCEKSEDHTQQVYEKALEEPGLTIMTRTLIGRQQAALAESHSQIKALRNIQHR